MKQISVKQFSNEFAAFTQCKEGYKDSHEDKINELCGLLPHGSGIDNGINFDFVNSKPERLVFYFGFHHMDQNGYYDGWTDHLIVITPSLQHSFNLRITGKDRNDIKDYLYDLFREIFIYS